MRMRKTLVVLALTGTIAGGGSVIAGTAALASPSVTQSTEDADNQDSDKSGLFGLLGLIGLAGLAKRKDPDHREATSRRNN